MLDALKGHLTLYSYVRSVFHAVNTDFYGHTWRNDFIMSHSVE
jgi:hypothetical protein